MSERFAVVSVLCAAATNQYAAACRKAIRCWFSDAGVDGHAKRYAGGVSKQYGAGAKKHYAANGWIVDRRCGG